ncbi:MAG TPA: DNA mismatch repair protein MutS, partial [Methanoregula sp.]|nr:DNA mismatch repair protein MutS [Methanoregula sp.]
KRVKNYHFAVRETKEEVVFLRKLIPGATDKSYGIHVARLAGIPKKVTERADALLEEGMDRGAGSGRKPQRYTQILLVDEQKMNDPQDHPALLALSRLNPDELTPIQALNALSELKKNLDGEKNP